MDYRPLGASGLKVPALSFGAGTFGGKGPLFGHWGSSDPREARRLLDLCLEAGVTLFDTADVYSDGASEEVLRRLAAGNRAYEDRFGYLFIVCATGKSAVARALVAHEDDRVG